MDVIYCDNHLLVVKKKAGIATQPDLQDLAKEFIKKKFAKPGAVFLEPIHRLDKPVAGLVLFARTSKALSRLNEAMRLGKIKKTYVAEVEGKLKASEGALEHFLVHGEFRAEVVSHKNPEGKKALLTYQLLSEKVHSCLVEIQLLTGRYHQIRAQFAAIGHPIVGDQKYGSKQESYSIALTHTELVLEHPVTKEQLHFQVPGFPKA